MGSRVQAMAYVRGRQRSFAVALSRLLRHFRARGLRRALALWVAALILWALARLFSSGLEGFEQVDLGLRIGLILAMAGAPLAWIAARTLPSRRNLVRRIDRELGFRDALVTGAELAPAAGGVCAQALKRWLSRELSGDRLTFRMGRTRASGWRRRWRRILQGGLLFLLLLFLLSLLTPPRGPGGLHREGRQGDADSGPESPNPARMEGRASADRRSQSPPQELVGGPGEEPVSPRKGGPEERPAPPPRDQPSAQREPMAPLPPEELDRRIDEWIVQVRESARRGPRREELFVRPDNPEPGMEGHGAGSARGDASRSPAEQRGEHLRSGGLRELRRIAEQAVISGSWSERERAWIEEYFTELSKL